MSADTCRPTRDTYAATCLRKVGVKSSPAFFSSHFPAGRLLYTSARRIRLVRRRNDFFLLLFSFFHSEPRRLLGPFRLEHTFSSAYVSQVSPLCRPSLSPRDEDGNARLRGVESLTLRRRLCKRLARRIERFARSVAASRLRDPRESFSREPSAHERRKGDKVFPLIKRRLLFLGANGSETGGDRRVFIPANVGRPSHLRLEYFSDEDRTGEHLALMKV